MKIFATASGNNQKPPLLFLHDFMSSSDEWSAVIKLLQNDYYCISIDLPGHGKSQYTSFDTWDDVIKECSKVLELIKKPTAIIGNSLGGRVALGLANLMPNNVSYLFLASTNPGISDALTKQQIFINDLKFFEQNKISNSDKDKINGWKNALKFLSIGRMPDYRKFITTFSVKIVYLYDNQTKVDSEIATELLEKFQINTMEYSHETFTSLLSDQIKKAIY